MKILSSAKILKTEKFMPVQGANWITMYMRQLVDEGKIVQGVVQKETGPF